MTEAESLELLRAEMDKQGMTDNSLRAGTAAIAMGESALEPHAEVSYAHTSNARIREVFGSRVSGMSETDLNTLKLNPEAFFDKVYGGPWGSQNLGNTVAGDGYKFRGRTVLQLTGRANYSKLKDMTGYDIITDPDLANKPEVSAAIAVAYMRWRYRGGGWEAMKAAVGNNTADIAASKDRFFARFMASGEMNVGNKTTTTTTSGPAPQPVATEVEEFQQSVKKIQTFLKSKGNYSGAVDGDFGPASRAALQSYISQK